MTMSKGAKKIAMLLRKRGFYVVPEYSFPDLKGKNGTFLRYDFAILYGGRPVVLVEYDGEAHFKQVKHFQKTENKLKQAQERDRRKNKYALLNNIKLYRVPYWEINNIYTYRDIFQDKFLVKTKYHNDYLIAP